MKKNNLSFVITMFFSILLTPVFGAKNDIPQWQQDINDRSKELDELQKQNGAGTEDVKHTEFPKTADDLSFSARVQLEKEGLVPYKDMKAYQELDIKRPDEWCPDHPNDPGCEKYKAVNQVVTNIPNIPVTPAKNSCTSTCGDIPVGHSCRPVTLSDCKNFEKTESNTASVKTWMQVCRDGGKLVCKPYACNKGYKIDDIPGKCVDDGTDYYYLIVYHYDWLTGSDTSDGWFLGSSAPCYAVCGYQTGGDDVNRKVLNPILGANYCTQIDRGFFQNEFIMKNVDTGEQIRFSKDQFTKIRDGLYSLKNEGNCDWHQKKIIAEIYKHDGKTNTNTRIDYIELDD